MGTQRCFLFVNLPGEIRSPGWDGKTLYPPGVNAVFHLPVPSQHVTMLSFLALDIYNTMTSKWSCYENMDHVLIETRGSAYDSMNLTICRTESPEGKVYRADLIFVRFIADWDKLRGTGFRLLYSFHSQGQTPDQLASGTWNCSVAFWASVQDHFPCNLISECVEGEDEKDCPYSSPVCESGEFFLGHSCYKYVKAGKVSWKFASAQCRNRGSQLVSLNDVNEWANVAAVLRQNGVPKAYTGLRAASPALPMM